MDYLKKAIWGPDPKEQMRSINQLLRKNKRELDKSMNQLQPLKKKTEGLIRKAAKEKDYKTAKLYAKELINVNRQYNKLYTSKTRIDSISMSINEQWQMNKLTQSLHSSTAVMRDVNQLVRIGVVSGTMQELSKELMKAGVINEMMDDMVDLDFEEDEELESESQDEVNKIIASLTEDKFSKINNEVPSNSIDVEEEPQIEQPEEEDVEALDEMRDRLRALQE
ncbi:Snf7-domain-containing protein [Scheffersomyces xylosifermentans]|uniref:Snf7-domain-containing protein n=1 Tax=Scheffersomyces xylosifermentans TaxID=1304137 RepID=UPI00315CCE14